MTFRKHGLPDRIVAVITGTVVLFIVTLGASLAWMGRALDDKAHASDMAQVENAQAGLLAQMQILLLDYAKWEAAIPRVQAKDISWINDNIGATAVTGFSFQLAVLWGGPFQEDLGWRDDGVVQPRSGLVDAAMLGDVERMLRRIPLNLYRGVEFFAWHADSLYVIGAARLEPDAPGVVASLISRDVETPRLLLGRRVDGRMVSDLGEAHLISGLRVVRETTRGQDAFPLLGGNGLPVAYLVWQTEHAGTDVLRHMALPLMVVILFATSLAVLGMVLVRRGAKQLVEAEHRASTSASTDALTGLPNRAAFNRAISAPAVAGQRAVLFLDVNGFKRINDSIGHAAGDAVIVYVAKCLAKLAAPDCLLARIAGDEFVFLLLGCNARYRAQWLAEAVDRALARPFSVLGHQMRVSVAMGYSAQEADDTTGDDLVRQADLAMYEAKRQRSTHAVAFGAVIEEASRDASLIEHGLRRAISHPEELSVEYQPIVDLRGQMVRAEALARWTSPDLGPIPPDRFIAVAEQAGLIVELGRRFLRLICDDLEAYPDLKVSINVSPLQLMAPDYVPGLVAELHERGLDASRIQVELTESVMVGDKEMAGQRLDQLRAAGFSTALDDFGTGYSSIGYLRHLRFDTLKIDRSLVSDFDRTPEGLAMLGALIVLSHSMGLTVVCEGVETAHQLERLRSFGCDLTQGYFLDCPLPIAALHERWLSRLHLDHGLPGPNFLKHERHSGTQEAERRFLFLNAQRDWAQTSAIPDTCAAGVSGLRFPHA